MATPSWRVRSRCRPSSSRRRRSSWLAATARETCAGMAFRFAEAWLFAAGLVLACGGLAGSVAGTFFAGCLSGLLPPVIIDAAAVGGAATATGSALAVLAVLHLLAA